MALLSVFIWIEMHTPDPMFRLELFKIRMFSVGNLAGFLASLSQGGLQFMLVIWLQGIWLPVHGYSFEETPLWAGIYMMPLMAGFIVIGPDQWLALGPLRLTRLRRGRHDDDGARLPRPDAAASKVQLCLLRAAAGAAWRGTGHVRRAEYHRHHEQRAR